MKMHNKKGFSLLELLVVVLIVGILVAISVPFYQRAVLRSRAAEVNNLLTMVRTRQTSKFAQDKKFAALFTDPALKKIASGPDDYEENVGAVKTVNSDYILKLRTNDARDKGCVTGTYSPGGEDKFTFAISYTQSGLGCTDADPDAYSVCGSFGNTVVGSVDDVCNFTASSNSGSTPSNPNNPPVVTICDIVSCPVGQQLMDCKCIPCEEQPKPGYQFAPEGCEWKPCEPCKEGFHFVEGCKCEADSTACDPCPSNQILVDNDTCKCACPDEKPVWDAASKQCVMCQEPTTWDPKIEKCVCPEKTPVFVEDEESRTGKCITCEESKPNSVWNSKKRVCECSCTGGRILIEDARTEEGTCNCQCPNQTPIWDANKKQCVTCSKQKPFYDATTHSCLSCYEKYGEGYPVWDENQKTCVSCYDKYPGKVVCSGSTFSDIEDTERRLGTQQNHNLNRTDYQEPTVRKTDLFSYAMRTGALLASDKPKCGSKDETSDSTTTFVDEPPQCTAVGQHATCQYQCVPLGLSGMEGIEDTCGATLTNGGMDSCTCDPQKGWVCPDQCEVISDGYYETSVLQPTECTMEPIITCDTMPDLTGWTPQGSCNNSWHNAKQYIPAKPVWVVNSGYEAGGYCASCGQVSVSACSTASGCGITYDHFSGKVWNGSACVNLPSDYYLESQDCVSLQLLPVAKCYSSNGSCEPACYWNKNTRGGTNCSIGGTNYAIESKGSATANIKNVLSSSSANITQVYRRAYNKDYYAIKELNIMPSLKDNVITE